jgi:hypothetical protein
LIALFLPWKKTSKADSPAENLGPVKLSLGTGHPCLNSSDEKVFGIVFGAQLLSSGNVVVSREVSQDLPEVLYDVEILGDNSRELESQVFARALSLSTEQVTEICLEEIIGSKAVWQFDKRSQKPEMIVL